MSALPLPLPVERDPAAPRKRTTVSASPSTTTRRKPKLVYALLALGGAALIAIAQIALSVATTQDSFVLGELSSQQRELNLRTHALHEELAGASSPQALATEASKLGMVVVGSPSYLRLSDGSITGDSSGTGWISSVDPIGAGAVANALLEPPAPPPSAAETEEATTDATGAAEQTPVEPQLPPNLDQGLPSPTTH